MLLLKTKALSKSYGGQPAVKNLNLEIRRGDFVAYLGTNGAGKSTTIKMLTGLLKPTSGQINYQEQLEMGIVFQDSILDGELTVAENLKSRAAMYKSVNQDWFEEIIKRLELRPILGQAYNRLSGGQRRRVDIARSLLNKPGLLFLDEPTTGLDIQTRQSIWRLLNDLRQQEGMTIFLTTHYLEEAETADYIYIIDQSQLLAEGSSQDLQEAYSQHQLLLRVKDSQLLLDHYPQLQVEGDSLRFQGLTSQEAIDFLARERDQILDFDYRKGGLSDAFLNITGKELI